MCAMQYANHKEAAKQMHGLIVQQHLFSRASIKAMFVIFHLLTFAACVESKWATRITVISDSLDEDIFLSDHSVEPTDLDFDMGDMSRSFRSVVTSSSGRDSFFELYSQWETYRQDTGTSMWTMDNDGKETLTKMHYLILPVWWNDQIPAEPADLDRINSVMEETAKTYSEMSWGKHNLTWEFLDQTTLTNVSKVNPSLGESKAATMAHIEGMLPARIEFSDYTGIMMFYTKADSGKHGGGGYAGVNANFVWMSLPPGYYVTRHEIGHNYGHPHHNANTYKWRTGRGSNGFAFDGWDMMSSGNGYARSDLAAASKWGFNWITDDAVVMMQPEGSSSACPQCKESVTGLVLKPFDDPGVPPSPNNQMAVHIPVLGSGGTAFSYWLSYRGFGNDGKAAGGLSIHMAYFRLGGIFGATYDSLFFDAFGDTEDDVSDAFVVPGSCYVVTAPGKIMDIDPSSGDRVQPIVCVDSVEAGKSITISVTFLNNASPPTPTLTLASNQEIGCSESGTNSGDKIFDVSGGKAHMLRYTGTGQDGLISLSLCMQSGSTSAAAYFYDAYPHAYISFESPPGYGAFRSLDVATACSDFSTKEYASEYGETYILVIGDSGAPTGTSVLMNSECTVSKCHANEYLSVGGICTSCPSGFVAQEGSTDISDCTSCIADGFELLHPKSPTCKLRDTLSAGISTAREWRVLATKAMTKEGWRWDVASLSLYASEECSEGTKVDTSTGIAFSSGSAGEPYWGGANAFSETTRIWGGRRDERDLFYLGIDITFDATVKCIIIDQKQALGLHVQARQSGATDWSNVWTANSLVDGLNVIPFMTSPTLAPSAGPSNGPTAGPSAEPSLHPVPAPTEEPSLRPVPAPTVIPSLLPVPAPAAGSTGAPPTTGKQYCFSELATVQVEHRATPVPMSALKVWDRVLTSKNIFEPVYAFGHLHTTQPATFLRISTNNTSAPLEITGEHMVFSMGADGPVRADSVKVGDFLFRVGPDQKRSTVLITRITLVERKGLYAPLTPDGTIVVDGILASTYVAAQSLANEYVQLGEKHVQIPMLQADLAHLWLTPLRLLCMGASTKTCERHDENGMHAYVTFGLKLVLWSEEQHVAVQATALALVVAITGVFRVIEILLSSFYGLLLFAAVAAWKVLNKNKMAVVAMKKVE